MTAWFLLLNQQLLTRRGERLPRRSRPRLEVTCGDNEQVRAPCRARRSASARQAAASALTGPSLRGVRVAPRRSAQDPRAALLLRPSVLLTASRVLSNADIRSRLPPVQPSAAISKIRADATAGAREHRLP